MPTAIPWACVFMPLKSVTPKKQTAKSVGFMISFLWGMQSRRVLASLGGAVRRFAIKFYPITKAIFHC